MAKQTRRSELTNPTGTAIGYSAPGASGPGFYQGLVGRKTGRAAPRPMGAAGRSPRHEAILAAHSLIDQGAADPNQGQLLSPDEMPHKASAKEMAAKHGVAPPLASSRPGFMPGLHERKDAAGRVVPATNKEAHRAMIGAVKRLGQFEIDPFTGSKVESARPSATHTLPHGVEGPQVRAPMAEALHQREQTRGRHPGDAAWYAMRNVTDRSDVHGVQGEFQLGPGSATEMIHNASVRQGIGYDPMSRAVAITSPRTAWTIGAKGTDDYAQPNVESAENVVRGVHVADAAGRATAAMLGSAEPHSMPEHVAASIGARASGRSLGEMKAKAAVDMVSRTPASAIPIYDLSSQKVPNFDQSLQQAHPSRSVRLQAAHSYTVDAHDVTSQGSHVDLLKTPGGYAVAQMLGKRTALRNRELAPMSQSGVWEGQRSKEPEPMGQQSLFETTRAGKVRPNPQALPGAKTPLSQQFDSRSDTAKKLGIEF